MQWRVNAIGSQRTEAWTNNISVTWELVRKAKFPFSPGIRNSQGDSETCGLTSSPGDSNAYLHLGAMGLMSPFLIFLPLLGVRKVFWDALIGADKCWSPFLQMLRLGKADSPRAHMQTHKLSHLTTSPPRLEPLGRKASLRASSHSKLLNATAR